MILASSQRPTEDLAAEVRVDGRRDRGRRRRGDRIEPEATPEVTRQTAILAFAAAIVFAVGLVTSARAVTLGMPVMWVALVARVLGVALVALPLAVTGRLQWARPALPFVVAAGVGEVLGTRSTRSPPRTASLSRRSSPASSRRSRSSAPTCSSGSVSTDARSSASSWSSSASPS